MNTKRFTILAIRSGSQSALLCALGHDGLDEEVQMDIDLREQFGVKVGDTISLEIEEAGVIGTLRWYLAARDPAIRVPALLGAWSFVLGVISLLLPLLS
ncbi:hypothetical protein [Rhizobium ruizarguesonis]|uniref:hypothetical protein n=1 Tax=Rhizobium ruizarguesonis TaxID=2081791 RepID=UPI001FE1513F|nr:hypothetical protein [Rhizobium ruizarguesonis]